MKYYVLNTNSRWVRVNKCGADTFTFKGDNIIYHFDNFVWKTKVK